MGEIRSVEGATEQHREKQTRAVFEAETWGFCAHGGARKARNLKEADDIEQAIKFAS